MRASLVTMVSVLLAVPGATYAQMQMSSNVVSARAQTAHYRLMLQIGPQEKMYSKDDAAKMHPTSGEIMVGGTMAGGGMAMGGMASDTRHLEVHVYDKATEKVVAEAKCAITVTNDATKKSTIMDVAAMYGVKEGPSDWHYGNNVDMPAGAYTVTVVVNSEKAVFHVTILKS